MSSRAGDWGREIGLAVSIAPSPEDGVSGGRIDMYPPYSRRHLTLSARSSVFDKRSCRGGRLDVEPNKPCKTESVRFQIVCCPQLLQALVEDRCTMSKRAVITYIRVSTSQQGRSGLGIEAQRQALYQFAKAEGLELTQEFVEVETGKGSDALAALAAAKRVKCHVAVAKLDRLSRDVHFISGLMAHRVPFVVTELG